MINNTMTGINNDYVILDDIKRESSRKEQLKKVSTEFESIFIAKMFSTLDKTVDRNDGIFGNEGKFAQNFKSYMFNEVGRQLASNPHSSFGFAKQIYEQMEKSLGDK